MSFSHTNKITFRYIAGGNVDDITVSKTETGGAEMNVSQAITTDASVETTDIDLEFFEFQTAAQAKSVYIRLDGFNGSLFANGSIGTEMAALADGEPYVWSDNGGLNFPEGNTNPMVDSTTKLTVQPDAGAGLETPGTITVRVLYDPAA